MVEPGTAAVVGGSLGGLFAANLLWRAGWDVHVYERAAEELVGRGAGIVPHPELMAVLCAVGVPEDEDVGVQVHERVTLARDGRELIRMPLPQVLTSWGYLYRLLRRQLPPGRYHGGRAVRAVRQTDRQVVLEMESGDTVTADLLVAADGLRSTVRQQLLPDVRPQYAGYVAWRGLADEAALSARTRAEVFPYFAFAVPPHEQMLGYPVASQESGTAPGQRKFNFVWYRPAAHQTTFRDMVTDAHGRTWLDGIPPPLIRPEVLDRARADAHAVLPPQFAEIVDKTANLFFQPIVDLESPRLAFGRIALMGDAAFVARPHCGMGVTKAASDAHALARALQQGSDVVAALLDYERVRQPYGRFIVGHARSLGAYLQAHAQDGLEHPVPPRSAEAVMRETAVPPPQALLPY
jgi:2-polyprenyl-6-methoxyphenol hydroxylase-like FAD-dependent oxidoreductase